MSARCRGLGIFGHPSGRGGAAVTPLPSNRKGGSMYIGIGALLLIIIILILLF